MITVITLLLLLLLLWQPCEKPVESHRNHVCQCACECVTTLALFAFRQRSGDGCKFVFDHSEIITSCSSTAKKSYFYYYLRQSDNSMSIVLLTLSSFSSSFPTLNLLHLHHHPPLFHRSRSLDHDGFQRDHKANLKLQLVCMSVWEQRQQHLKCVACVQSTALLYIAP